MNKIRLTGLLSRFRRLHRLNQEWSVAALNSTKASHSESPISHIVAPQVADKSIVVTGDVCSSICAKYGISLSDFYSWNPGVGSKCQSLWLNTYCCVGRIWTLMGEGTGRYFASPLYHRHSAGHTLALLSFRFNHSLAGTRKTPYLCLFVGLFGIRDECLWLW